MKLYPVQNYRKFYNFNGKFRRPWSNNISIINLALIINIELSLHTNNSKNLAKGKLKIRYLNTRNVSSFR